LLGVGFGAELAAAIASSRSSNSAVIPGRCGSIEPGVSLRVMLESKRLRQFRQLHPHAVENAGIVPPRVLPEQANARIPGALLAIEHPAIIRQARPRHARRWYRPI